MDMGYWVISLSHTPLALRPHPHPHVLDPVYCDGNGEGENSEVGEQV